MVRTLTGPTAAPSPTPPPSTGEESLELQLDGPAVGAKAEPGIGEAKGPRGLRLEIGSATSAGRVRERNEDSFLVNQLSWANLDRREELALVVVADGMGGYEAGDRASALVVRQIGEAFAPVFAKAFSQPSTPDEIATILEKAIKTANAVVHQQGQSDPKCKGMGATAAVAVVSDEQVRIGHIGDCRVYHARGGDLKQVTRDQTLVARMVDLGKLTPQEALVHPQRNEVTQAIGKHADIRPEPYQVSAKAGDWLIVACDGLHAHVDATALLAAILEANGSAAELAQHLVELANQGGGSDNCTVVALRFA